MFKKSLIFVVAFAASLSMAGVASAQESNFEGFYVGGQAGYSIIEDDLDGFGGGGFVGFGGTNGSIYGSIEAEIGYDGAQWDTSVSTGGVTGSAELEAQLTYGLGFRAGAVVADNFLIYGRVGWVRTNVELDVDITVANVGSFSGTADEDFDGGRVGVGVEGMFADNIGVRGEYTYTAYESDIDQHLFRVGVAYYF